MTNPVAIGIDLGTTYSCVGVVQHGKVEIIANEFGNRTTPSWVGFTDSERLIGEAAKNQAANNSANTVYDAKRLIGRKFDDTIVQNDMKHWPFRIVDENNKPVIKVKSGGETKTYHAEEISAMVLTRMKDIAEQYLGKPVADAVITVPAYFNDSQRQATKDAGTIAGLNVLRIVNEPTAAAIAYGLENEDNNGQNVLVFDLGGGTFDVSILEVVEQVFEVRSTEGDTHLGGEDFDNKLVDFCIQEIKRKHKKDLSQNQSALTRLRCACENAKRQLSAINHAVVEVDSLFDDTNYATTLTRSRFENLNQSFFEKTLQSVQTALASIKMRKNQIKDIVLVGGSSRIPKVQAMVREFFDGKELKKTIHPDEAVAYGAAVLASSLIGDENPLAKDLVLMDVTPLSLGTEIEGGEMSVIIKKNSTIPTKKTKSYVTVADYQQTMAHKVFEGERAITADNNQLGEFKSTGLPPRPRGEVAVNVTFEVDYNGILSATAVIDSTGDTSNITIKNEKGHLTTREISRMIEDAEKFRTQDLEWREKVTAMRNFKDFVFKKRTSTRNLNINDSHKTLIVNKCTEVIDSLTDGDLATREQYEQWQQELEEYCRSVVNNTSPNSCMVS